MRYRVVLLSIVAGLSMNGCCAKTSCVKPPVVETKSDVKAAGDIAAKLEALKVDASLKAEFAQLIESQFAHLSDANAALLLFLSALDCYLQRGAPEFLLKEMTGIVRARFAAAQGLLGAPSDSLTPLERNVISKSRNAPLIFMRLREFGVE